MAFKYTLRTERVDFGEDDFIEVRGLSVPDIAELVEVHRADLAPLFERFAGRTGKKAKVTDNEVMFTLEGVITKFPDLAAHVLALAADAREDFSAIRVLPLDVQLIALEKVGKLTFATQGGIKNLAETVLRMAEGVNGLASELKTPLQ